jgi:hypothetical protein
MSEADKPKPPSPLAMAALSKAFKKVGEEQGVQSFIESAERLKVAALEAKQKEAKAKGDSNE